MNNTQLPPLPARGLGADQGHVAPLGADHREDPARARCPGATTGGTSPLPIGAGPDHPPHAGRRPDLEIELDLVDHRVRAAPPTPTPASTCTTAFPSPTSTAALPTCSTALDVHVDIRAEPFGVPMTTPFAADHDHASYDPAAARFLRVLQWSADVFEEFAGWYCGKSQPRALVLAQLRPRLQSLLRQAGGGATGRRPGHGRGLLP